MRIQVNTDKNIQGSAELTQEVETLVLDSLSRFGEWITRVEVQLSDENSSAKTRDDDIRCVLEARPAGQQPLGVTHQAATVDQALKGGLKKLVRVLNDNKEKHEKQKGNTSFAGEES